MVHSMRCMPCVAHPVRTSPAGDHCLNGSVQLLQMNVQGVVVLLLLLKPLHTGTNKGKIIKTWKTPRCTP